MEFKPFWEIEPLLNELHTRFKAEVRNGKGKIYKPEIEIAELNDGLIIERACQCDGMVYKSTIECKHLKQFKEYLKNWGVDIREVI